MLPGVYKDDTPLSAQGFYTDSNNIRFVRDKLQTRGGCEYAATGVLLGYCRGMHAWRDNSALSYVGMGTHSNTYAYSDGYIYDISPIIARGQVSVSFTTTITSAVVTADWTAHGLVEGQSFSLRNSTVSTVGGVTIDTAAATATAPSPAYVVVAVATANQFTYTAASAATSSAGPTAATVDYYQFLAPGLADSLGGAGYGTGGYGSGTYGTSSATTFACRTWALDNWQQNLLACPRNGGLFEFSPLFTQTELAAPFTTSASWTLGGQYAITAGVLVATAGSVTDASTSITMTQAAWFAVEFDTTSITAGSFTPYIGSVAIGAAITTNAHYARTFYTGTNPFKFTKDASFAGKISNITIKQQINLITVTNAPTQNTCMLVTPEFICMLFGTVERVSGNFNPLCIRTSDQFANPANTGIPLQTWTPSSSNQSVETYLAEGGRIVGAMNGRGEVLAWTDTALYSGRYVPDPNIVYSFTLVAMGCGLMGPNAACIVEGVAYWMGNNGTFYRYAGGAVEPLESTCRRDVFDHLAPVQGDKVYASEISAFGEAQWLYPDDRDGTGGTGGIECSRYLKLNVSGNSVPCWDVGSYARTAWMDQGIVPYPMAAGTDGYSYFQEKGDSVNGAAMAASFRTGAIQIGDGQNLWQCSGVIPDIEDQQGTLALTPYTYLYPATTPTANGPYSVMATSEKVDFIVLGRQIAFNGAWNTAPLFGRMGSWRMDIKDSGMQF